MSYLCLAAKQLAWLDSFACLRCGCITSDRLASLTSNFARLSNLHSTIAWNCHWNWSVLILCQREHSVDLLVNHSLLTLPDSFASSRFLSTCAWGPVSGCKSRATMDWLAISMFRVWSCFEQMSQRCPGLAQVWHHYPSYSLYSFRQMNLQRNSGCHQQLPTFGSGSDVASWWICFFWLYSLAARPKHGSDDLLPINNLDRPMYYF